ncbi:MAG: transcription antitermination factor NusB [Verrucomicrobiae bacterium]|nr:transcription antitermination factor NusB [Verrucomicrobiae bacterium]
MSSRREARELALQFLYQYEMNPGKPEDELRNFWAIQQPAKKRNLFTEELVLATLQHQAAVDTKIKAYAQNWKFDRIAAVDRNILRLAIYELLFREDIPPIVSINEALELAKRYSTQDSSRFINGILDRVKEDLGRPLRSASKKSAE